MILLSWYRTVRFCRGGTSYLGGRGYPLCVPGVKTKEIGAEMTCFPLSPNRNKECTGTYVGFFVCRILLREVFLFVLGGERHCGVRSRGAFSLYFEGVNIEQMTHFIRSLLREPIVPFL